jgi:hypothetical protein
VSHVYVYNVSYLSGFEGYVRRKNVGQHKRPKISDMWSITKDIAETFEKKRTVRHRGAAVVCDPHVPRSRTAGAVRQ